MITFDNTGISSNPTKSGRALVYTDIIRNGETYHWAIYVPQLNGQTLGDYMTANADVYEQDIIRKEALWASMPHTEEITDIMGGGTITVDIPKSRIVCATIPDYIESVSDFGYDIASIKRLLQILTNTVLTGNTLTQKQINDLAVIHDFYVVGIPYKTNDIFDYNGKLYRVLQDHTSQANWLPNEATSLYVVKTPEGTIPDWVQPAGAHDAYVKFSKVKHNGITWESLIDYNVWEPNSVGAESLWLNKDITTTTTTTIFITTTTTTVEVTTTSTTTNVVTTSTTTIAPTTSTTTIGLTTTTTTGEVILPWVQPTGAGDAYNIGDKVTFEGFTWRSLINANVWSPSVYPAGWEKI